MRKTFSFLFLLFLIFSGLGCSTYHFGQYKRTLPGGYDRIAIPMFENKSQEVGVEAFLTDNLRAEFERSKLAKITSKNDAQVILEGTITGLTFVGSNAINNTSSDIRTLVAPYPADPTRTNPLPKGTTLNKTYTATMIVVIAIRKVSDHSILWSGGFSRSRNYAAPLIGTPLLTGANALYNQNSRVLTVERMAKDMMAEAHDRITENF